MAGVADNLCRALSLRGPNDQGHVVLMASRPSGNTPAMGGGNVLLGQTRLSVIDLSLAAHQPMGTDDGRYWLAYNGEIYNYLELRAELEKLGVAFHSSSDTEVLLQAYAMWGRECLLRFTGMFAFAIYDRDRGTVFCARDFFGIKPFFFHQGPAGFCFASELPALLEFPCVPRRLHWQSAYDYLRFGSVGIGAETLLDGIESLPPAHWIEIDARSGRILQKNRYWRIDLSRRQELSFSDASDRLRELFLESVRLHLRSDVPLGVALSGGIDSSAIACAMRRLEPDLPIRTFSFVAAGTELSEEPWIDLVTREIKAIPSKIKLEAGDLVQNLDAVIQRQGEPFASTSIFAQHCVFRRVRQEGVVVTLEGQGADELLGGYSGYPAERILSLLLHLRPLAAWRFLRCQKQWPGRNPRKLALHLGQHFTPDFLIQFIAGLVGESAYPGWLKKHELRERQVGIRLERTPLWGCRDKLRQVLANEATRDSLPNLLRYGDRNSMSYSVESRVPFCTREMAEFCLSLPEEYLVDASGMTKAVFRHAMRGLVPQPILDRRDKIGFATPEKLWLSELGDWVEDTLKRAPPSRILDLAQARVEWAGIRRGQRPFSWRVWRWVNYLRWREIFHVQE